MIYMGKTADEAWQPFEGVHFLAFRDASYLPCSYKCTILDCLRGLEFGMKMNWFNVDAFNVREYEFYEQVENGDMNWIIPGKFMAFSTPHSKNIGDDGVSPSLTPVLLLHPRGLRPHLQKI